MDGKSFLIDVSRCTGCRGCQVACKQWNELPATKTTQTGTYQNPPDFNENTYKLVRFAEGRIDGKPYWNFFSDMCRHCLNPPCFAGLDDDEIVQDEATGAVIFTKNTDKSDYDICRAACPYDIPRQDEKTGVMHKCTMCLDRVREGMQPACVLSCPTQAVEFGDRKDILKKMEERLVALKKRFPKVRALNADDVRVIYIVTDDPARYHEYAE